MTADGEATPAHDRLIHADAHEVIVRVRALRVKLTQAYGPALGPTHVARVIDECAARLAKARFSTYVPVLLEKAARDRLREDLRTEATE